ncbi:MAG TPA: ATP-binding cassette domain-containing protein [Prosthecobacter sp.]|nr:ATP-binding cassette domain-containing protein [Prosthecobacter sp.]
MPGLSLTNLHFAYPGSSFRLRVDSLQIAEGGRFALLGPSGAGKTTLLRLMAGLLRPDSGAITLGATQLTSLSETARRDFRLSEVGLIFQDFALLDYLTVAENILLPQRFGSGTRHPSDARGLADRLHIVQHWHRLAGQLSQGERQRVAIARALAHRPSYVFADEPTASLDAARRGIVMDLLLDYTQQSGACLVMVTHDSELMPLFPDHARVQDFTSS